MKTAIFLLGYGLLSFSAVGQQAKSLMRLGELEDAATFPANLMHRNQRGASNKTTVGNPFWYSYTDVLFQPGVSKIYANIVYSDSNLVYQSIAGPTNVFIHGIGLSFDPADSAFYYNTSAGQIQDYDYVNQEWIISGTQSYSIDSIAFVSKYFRSQNITDSLIIYIAKVSKGASPINPPGLYALSVSASNTNRFVTAWFDSSDNSLVVSPSAYTRLAIALDSSYYVDTTSTGFSMRSISGFAFPSPIVAASGQKILAYVTFKSAFAYVLGTPITSANHIRMYSYDLPGVGGPPIQNQNSYQSGLIANSAIKYENPDYTFTGKSVLVPSVGITTEGYMTHMAFRVTCLTCIVGVHEMFSPFTEIKASPNPANEYVSISFKVNVSADGRIMVYSILGQPLKSVDVGGKGLIKETFRTHDLPNGVYFYVVEANGHRKTGRFVVSH